MLQGLLRRAPMRAGGSREKAGVEGERRGNVSREVGRIVAAGIDMKLVRNFAGREDFVKRGGTCLETEIVLVSAIEINLHSG